MHCAVFVERLGEPQALAAAPATAWLLSCCFTLVDEANSALLTATFLTWKLLCTPQPRFCACVCARPFIDCVYDCAVVETAASAQQLVGLYNSAYVRIQALFSTLGRVPLVANLMTVPQPPPVSAHAFAPFCLCAFHS